LEVIDHWYSLASDEELRQGEILLNVPIYIPTTYVGVPAEDSEQEAVADITDVILITPSCDLVRKPIVVLCAHWDLSEQMRAGKLNRDAVSEIEKGRRPLSYILPASPFREVPMGTRIVDFSRIHSLPRGVVAAHAQTQRYRLRLLPPFCEHFAQAFGRCYMRIGLPSSATEYSDRLKDPEPLPQS
jgi:hypothetical protein